MARSSDTETIFDPDELYRADQTYKATQLSTVEYTTYSHNFNSQISASCEKY